MIWRKPPLKFKLYLSDAVWEVPAAKNECFLTFDDGPHPETTPFILEELAQYNFKATFFCLGKQVAAHPRLFDAIIEAGHAVGNHTYSHLNCWSLNNKSAYLEDVAKAQQLINSKLFRPPYGRLFAPEYKALQKDYKIVMWSFMPEDFRIDLPSQKILKRLLENIGKRNNIVLHENDKSKQHLKNILPTYLKALHEQGFQLKTLEHVN